MTDLTERAVADIEADVRALPPDVLDGMLARNIRATRVAIVPGYHLETLFGQFRTNSCSYLLHASGTGRTSTEGTAEIDVDVLLRCVQPGQPRPPGLVPEALVVSAPLVMIGPPHTVVTARGSEAVVFTSERRDEESVQIDAPSLAISWSSPTPRTGSRVPLVVVTGRRLDGAVAARATFDWHLTVELVLQAPLPG